MVKTTLYLPDDLKQELERLAAETGRSEESVPCGRASVGRSLHFAVMPALGLALPGGRMIDVETLPATSRCTIVR